MQIGAIKNLSFQAKIRSTGNPLESISVAAESASVPSEIARGASTAPVAGTSSLPPEMVRGMSTMGTGGTATSTIGSGSEVAGTAFLSESTGADSSGIVPQILEEAESLSQPSSIEWAAQHPSLVGLSLSTTGASASPKWRVTSSSSEDPS